MSRLSKSSHYQPDIQGLRALAVALVIFYHSGLPGLPGGFIGVDVFFVISGYVITTLLLREFDRNQRISLSRFYARRMRRLLPAATLVLVVTTVVAWMTYSPMDLWRFSASAFATAVYLSNFWFAHLSTDYLAADESFNPLLHTWSLGVEEQFYLVWPWLLILAYRGSTKADAYRRLLGIFAVLIVGSLLLGYFLTHYLQPWAFFGSPARAWEFAVGGLIALWFTRGALLNPNMARATSWLGLSLIMLGAIFFDADTAFPGFAALVPVAGAGLLIAAAHTRSLRGANRLLAPRPMQFIGDMSYSLYLWHWPVFVFFADVTHPAEGLDVPTALVKIAVVFLLSLVTLLFVENPVRFSQRLSAKRALVLLFGALLTTSTAALAFGVRKISAQSLLEPMQKTFLAAQKDHPRIRLDGCHVSQRDTEAKNCTYGMRNGQFLVVLFGDSHAAHWFPALERLATSNGWKLISATKSACPSVMFEKFHKKFGRPYTECNEWRENVLRELASARPDLVVVANSYGQDASADQWQTDTGRLLARLAPISDRVVIIRDVPRPFHSIPHCLSKADWLGKDPAETCLVNTGSTPAQQKFLAEMAAARAYPNVHVVDLSDEICPETPCPAYSDGVVKYKDDHHLTATYSRSLAQPLERQLLPD